MYPTPTIPSISIYVEDCLDILDEIFESLRDILFSMETRTRLMDLIDPLFDPFQTIGKYESHEDR